MKRSTIIAVVAATAVVGGGAAASAALNSGSAPSAAAQQLRADSAGSTSPGNEDAGQGAPDGTDGTGTDGDRDDRGDDDDRDDRDDRDDGRQDTGAGGATVDAGVTGQVIRTALDAVPGYVVEIDLDDDDGRHWDVEVAGDDGREHELEISLDGTRVLDQRRDGDDDVRADRRVLSEASVQAAEAVRIAEAYVGGQVRDLDLDRDDRVWEVELRAADGTEWELDVDLRTGEVRDVEQDD